ALVGVRGGDHLVCAWSEQGAAAGECLAPGAVLDGYGAAVPVIAHAAGLLRGTDVFHSPHTAPGVAPFGADPGHGGVSRICHARGFAGAAAALAVFVPPAAGGTGAGVAADQSFPGVDGV